MSGPQHRTQAMRRESTRRKLIQATLQSMLENGCARMTTAEVAERAGVSRGALTHHFPSKDDLVTTAVEYLLVNSTQEIREQAARIEKGELDLDGFVEHLWRLFSGPLFYLTLEHVTEARHNCSLREKMIPVVRRFHAALDAIWSEFFRQTSLTSVEVDTTLNMTLCLLRGMGLQTVLRDDPAYYRRLLEGWKTQLCHIIEANQDENIRTRAIGAER